MLKCQIVGILTFMSTINFMFRWVKHAKFYNLKALLLFFSGPPDIPNGPLKVSEIGYTDLMLSWQPPEHDGGSPLTGFMIEKREKSKSIWQVGKTDSKTTQFHVTKLTPGNEYFFCVVAKNDVGSSRSLWTEVVATRTQTGKYLLIFNSFRVLMIHKGFVYVRLTTLASPTNLVNPSTWTRERSDSVVECLTRDRGTAGLSLTGVTALWSLSLTHLS